MFKVILLSSFVAVATCGKLPPVITACAKGDNACALASAQKALPELMKGYKPLKIRTLSPYKFDKIDLSTGNNLKVELHNGLVNMQSVTINDVIFDTENQKYKTSLDIVVDSDYEVNGKILILPVEGKGKCHIEIDKIDIEYNVKLKTVERKSKKYFEMVSDEISINMAALRLRFDNLFNGDKALGDNVNNFVNENWQDVEKEFHDGIINLITSIVREIYRPILEHVPIDEIFLS